MKRIVILWHILLPTVLLAQYHSWDGQRMSPNARLGCLNIFVNIIYDVHPDTNVFNYNELWPRITDTTQEGINNTAIPVYLLDWMDTVYVPGQLHGTCTRIFGESSFDSLQITGDFMVVNIRESTVLQNNIFNDFGIKNAVFDLIRRKGFSTIYGHNQIADYDHNGDNKIDFINVLLRNITKSYGGLNSGSGHSGSPGPLFINGVQHDCENGTLQCVGDGDFFMNPSGVVIHEISHNLFGGNDFHTSGGNHMGSQGTMAFLNTQGGHGLMGAGGSSLVCCNGYERWRMHWRHPQAADYISAQDSMGLVSVASDITREDGNVSFVLRDFVTYGDAVRIKMPYKDSETSSNQYIWIENHQIRSDKLDFLQYSNTHECRPQGKPGIYAYYQIGRDVLESDNSSEIWDRNHRDNLKVIPAEGYYDYVLVADTHNLNCVSYVDHHYSLRREKPNAFCGGQDQEEQFVPQAADSLLYLSGRKPMWRKIINGINDDHLACIGDTLDAFAPPVKINMGTNPSSCNAKTCHSYNTGLHSGYMSPSASHLNTQTTYLTGLSIEMLEKNSTTIQVNIRWDDYYITNDTRWTGKIALKDTAILAEPYSITLAQNKTVALPYRDAETGLFAGRTQWRCESGSYFRQNDSTHVYLTENSSLIFENGSTYEQTETAVMCVQAGCSLYVQSGATAKFLGTMNIDSGAVVVIKGVALLGDAAHLTVNPGGKLIVDGGTITSAEPGAMWKGIEVVGDRTKHQVPQYQGVVELKNGAVIENAITAIRTGLRDEGWHTTGGIITATNAIFRNNQRSLEFLSYCDTDSAANLLDNCSYFVGCTFTIDTNNVLAQNNRQFTNHVTMWDVKNVRFKGCIFENKMNRGRLCEGKGIATIDAGFSLTTYPFPYATYSGGGSSMPDTFMFNTFTGFYTAVEVTTTGNQYAVKLDETKFDNNQQAISVNGNNHVEIIRCDVNQTDYKAYTVYQRKGISLNNSTGYHIEGNFFYDNNYLPSSLSNNSKYGIKITNSGILANIIYRNNFTKMANGILVSGTNGNARRGLQFVCNNFSRNDYDIKLMSSTVVSPQQGSLNSGADNNFSGTYNYNLYNGGGSTVTYLYNSTSPLHYPSLTYQVVLSSQGISSNPCYTTILDINPNRTDYNTRELATMVSSYQELNSARNLQWEVTSEGTYSSSPISPEMMALQQEASNLYYETVRQIMLDSITDMSTLAEWHETASIFADPYSWSETMYQADETADYANIVTDDIAERDNYAAFRALKSECASLTMEKGVNWYAMSEEQIERLIRIAELNTGRTSVMAKGILCFFFNICYEDVDETMDTYSATCQEIGFPNAYMENEAKTSFTDDQENMQLSGLVIYPNPANQTFTISFTETQESVSQVRIINMQGKEVLRLENPSSNMVNIANLPAGMYVVRVLSQSGGSYSTKLVKE